jgi:hypothetical protein
MFLEIIIGLFLIFGIWSAAFEMITMRRWLPRETGHFLLIGVVLLFGLVVTGAI